MSDKITVYISSISSSQEGKKNQTHIMDILGGKKIDYESVDVSLNREDLDKMREIANNPKALVPQICKGNTYLGDHDAFCEAVEDGALNDFLKLSA